MYLSKRSKWCVVLLSTRCELWTEEELQYEPEQTALTGYHHHYCESIWRMRFSAVWSCARWVRGRANSTKAALSGVLQHTHICTHTHAHTLRRNTAVLQQNPSQVLVCLESLMHLVWRHVVYCWDVSLAHISALNVCVCVCLRIFP